jgi:hypothetical protein
MWSKHLVPKPKDWETHIDVVGFFLDKSSTHLPPLGIEVSDFNPWNQRPIDQSLPEIVRSFLQNGPPPIFVGFGSMVVDNPLSLIQVTLFSSFLSPHLRQIFVEAAASLGVRIIFQSGWTEMNPELFRSFCDDIETNVQKKGASGVKALKDILVRQIPAGSRIESTTSLSYLDRLWRSSDALLIGACSHDSLFPHIAAVVHHGGAGDLSLSLPLSLSASLTLFLSLHLSPPPAW